MGCVPLVGTVPLQPPEAVHEVAFAELQVKVATLPLVTDVGTALNEAVGAGGDGVTGTDPDPPQAANTAAAAIVNTVFNNRELIFRFPYVVFGGLLRWKTAFPRAIPRHRYGKRPTHNPGFVPAA